MLLNVLKMILEPLLVLKPRLMIDSKELKTEPLLYFFTHGYYNCYMFAKEGGFHAFFVYYNNLFISQVVIPLHEYTSHSQNTYVYAYCISCDLMIIQVTRHWIIYSTTKS